MGHLAFDIGEGYKNVEVGGNFSKDGGIGRTRVRPILKQCDVLHPPLKGHQNILTKKKKKRKLNKSSRCLAYLT